ncbi:MAG: TIGR02452 family protein [Verrucomicrobia bacterium]|nr:TIGR02452 family protein [Verrucomicrobiota bacterium]MCH8510347.1 TIGR02452 family protein [Kiritimatiellia bacterium]
MPYTYLPLQDSPEMAAARKRELVISRHDARQLAVTALEAARAGVHLLPDGTRVLWGNQVANAIAKKKSIPPTEELPAGRGRVFDRTTVQVGNETTLGSARRLVVDGHRPLALNFANGIHPGGGFLHGARAQEENLCRSSALYLTLENDPMYAAHRKNPLPTSSDWCILSPDVPVFRTDDGTPLAELWPLSFITCAAPVADAVGREESARLLKQRIHRVLAIAAAYRYDTLVLGAWGCGAFGNAPLQTARDFRSALETRFDGVFRHIVFAITDWSPERRYLTPFHTTFS